MARAREKLPQLGFWDSEVTSASHDEIVLWAYQNAEQLIRSMFEKFSDRLKNAGIDASPDWNREILAQYGNEIGQPRAKRTAFVKRRDLEAVLRERTSDVTGRYQPRILGYADLLIEWEVERLSVFEDVGSKKKEWHYASVAGYLLVEAKTVLPTVGELMRQVNLYREAYSTVAVVAPDNRYSEILEEQGILFVHYRKESE